MMASTTAQAGTGTRASYQALLARMAELDRALPIHSLRESDLTKWDRKATDENEPSRRFLWCVGAYGTTLTWVDPPKGETAWSSAERARWTPERSRSFVETLAECRPFFHLWDGVTLRPVTAEQAVSLLCEGEWIRELTLDGGRG